ncbi:MAG: sugar ABC transporter permease [Caldilineaceae bacterium]
MGVSTAERNQAQERAAPRRRRRRRTEWLPYWLVVPSLLLILMINLYPFATGFMYSLRDGTMLKEGDFVGLANYTALLTDSNFHHSLWFSVLFSLGAVFGSYVIGLALALLLNKDIPFRGFFRVALLVPWIIPSVVSIISWRWMINTDSGLLNLGLTTFGFDPVYLLSTERQAMFAVIVVKIWRSFPFMMLSLLAALQTIDLTLYEAAQIDGAGRWQSFRFITFPHLRDLSIVLWILMTIWSVNDFETPYLLTGGGPSNATENLIVLAYRYTFRSNQVGSGTAVAFVTLILLMILALLLLRRQGSEQEAQGEADE